MSTTIVTIVRIKEPSKVQEKYVCVNLSQSWCVIPAGPLLIPFCIDSYLSITKAAFSSRKLRSEQSTDIFGYIEKLAKLQSAIESIHSSDMFTYLCFLPPTVTDHERHQASAIC